MTTSTRIVFDLADGVAAKEGNTPTISDVLDQCDLTDLATSKGVAHKWATFEPDEWLLDGNYHILEEASAGASIGIMSGTISGAAGAFAVPPELTITFDGDYELVEGVTLHFNSETGDYCDDVDIDFYDSGDVLLDSGSYTPNDTSYFCALPSTPISSVRYLVITFNSTAAAYRHLRLTDIEIDSISFKGSDVKSAILVEEIDVTSMRIPSNSIEMELFSSSGDFSVFDVTSIYYKIKPNQPVYAYETIDGTEYFVGKFYIGEWESKSINTLIAKVYDAITLADKKNSLGYYYNTVTAAHRDALEVLGYLFDDAGLDYTLDTSLEDLIVTGFVDAISVRDTLRAMLVSIGAYATCVRSKTIDVIPFEMALQITAPTVTLDETDRSLVSPIKLLPLVTSVIVKSHRFKGTSEIFTVVNQDFLAGSYRIFWRAGSPQAFDAITGATRATNSNKRWATYEDITVAADGTVTLDVERYTDSQLPYETANPLAPSGAVDNVVQVDELTTMFPSNDASGLPGTAEETSIRLNDYYTQRYLQITKLFGRLDLQPGDRVITDMQGTAMVGIIERMATDLAGGCVSELSIRCVKNQDVSTSLDIGKYNSDHANITYSTGAYKNWSTAVDASAYDGDLEYTDTNAVNTPYALFTFVGSRLIIVYTEMADRGKLEVTIDSVVVDTIDEYAAGTTHQVEWDSGYLAYGFHSVLLRAVYDPVDGAEVVDIDAVEIQ